MELITILLRQLLTMAIYMTIGFLLFRAKMLTSSGTKDLGRLLLYIVMPAAIINSYMTVQSRSRTLALLVSFMLAVGALILSMVISTLLYRKQGISLFGASFSNAGFMGIPIVSAVLGEEAVFYVSSFVALLNIFQWTFGVKAITGRTDTIRCKKLITNPIVIAAVVGMFLYFSSIPVPSVFRNSISVIAGMNAPLAMIVLGAYLAEADVLEMITNKANWGVSAVRLLLIPILTGAFLILIPADKSIKTAILIASCAPVGSNAAVFAQMFGKDYTQATCQICLSTVLSLLTMPAVVTVFQLL